MKCRIINSCIFFVFMLSMRLMRFGAKHKPFYYLVVIDSRRPIRSRYVEKLGFYNPMVPKTDDMRFKFDSERVRYRLSVGANPSDRVKYLLQTAGFDFSLFPKIKPYVNKVITG